MRILYGVVGEGMGHATRSRVILEHLLQKGHEIRVVVSGRAATFLAGKFAGRARIAIEEIHGLHLKFDGNDLDVTESILSNLTAAPEGVRKNFEVYARVTAGFDADVVVSDFESFAYFFGRVKRLPVISIDNMQVINRCRHNDFVTDDVSFSFQLARLAVKAKLPGAYHYLVSSFFFPPVAKPRTTLVPPILRPEILAAVREPGDHVVVYQTAATNADALVKALKSLPGSFFAYGTGKTGIDGNVTFCPFSETTFVEHLRTARAVIAGGGYSLMGEAVHLRVPMLSVPIQGQYEQELNARYLQKLGYGTCSSFVDGDVIASFLKDTAAMQHTLSQYEPRDNTMLFACLDELLRHVELDEPPPVSLSTPSLGTFTPPLPAVLAQVVETDDTDPNLHRGRRS
jgi:uncharacterized protein (TIGR00661 family)